MITTTFGSGTYPCCSSNSPASTPQHIPLRRVLRRGDWDNRRMVVAPSPRSATQFRGVETRKGRPTPRCSALGFRRRRSVCKISFSNLLEKQKLMGVPAKVIIQNSRKHLHYCNQSEKITTVVPTILCNGNTSVSVDNESARSGDCPPR